MDHLTRHYMHLCEQLQEKINFLEKRILLERPSIEDQIETGNETILDVSTGKTKGYAKAGNVKVPFDITIDPELLKTSARGEFRFSNLAVSRRLYPEVFADTKELKGTMALNPNIKVNDDNTFKAIRDQDTVAHEAAHAHQLAAKVRDAEQREAKGKSTYARVERRDIERASTPQRSSNPRLANISPKIKSSLEYSRYYLNPQEVNARSAAAGTMAYRMRSVGGYRNYSFSMPQIHSLVGLDFVAGGSKASPEETSALTRHERSVAKRKNLLARKDLRDAAARGVLKAEQDMQAPDSKSETAKTRQAEIKAKVEALKGKSEQPKISVPEPTPTKTAKIASGFIDPASAAIQATTTQASKISPQFAAKPLLGTQIKGVGTGLSVGGGVIGGLAGEYVIKPAAEKAGVFKAVETGTRETLSRMPDWAANAADTALGAAQAAIDPVSAMQPIMQKGIDRQSKREVDSALKAEKPSQVRFSGPKV